MSPEPVCDDCRKNGIPQVRIFDMPLHHQLALEAYMGEADPKAAVLAASKASGLKPATIKEMIRGRRAPEFRRVFQLCLEAKGLHIGGIVSILAECAGATEQKWNPAEGQFNEFKDFRTRLNTAKAAAKFLELEPPKSGGGPGQVNQIVIQHNLGSGEEIDPPSVFRVKPPGEVVDVETS